VGCQDKHQNAEAIKKQRDVDQEYCDDESFENIETTKVLFEEALR
jgi:hypothetical protein